MKTHVYEMRDNIWVVNNVCSSIDNDLARILELDHIVISSEDMDQRSIAVF